MKSLYVKIAAAAMAVILIGVSGAFAQAPNTIMYQGKLTNSSGLPITTATSVIFAIYSAASGGTAIWTETISITPNAQGIFTQELGLTTALPANLFNGTKRYIGIKVGADAEMTPRQVLTSGPYSISTGNIADGSVTGAKILDGTITDADISDEPGINTVNGTYNVLLPLTSAGQSFISTTLAAPTAGYALVVASGTCFISHTNGTWDNIILKLSTTSGDIAGSVACKVIRIPSEMPSGAQTFCIPFCLTFVFAVSAGNTTFHLNGYDSQNTGNDNILQPTIAAVYFPTRYGTGSMETIIPGATQGPDMATGADLMQTGTTR